MSQHDFNIANQTASATRADLNNALGALASLSSGTTAPTTTFANMLWYETDTNWLWVRNEADSAWIRFAYFDQANSLSSILDNTKVVNTSGNQTGVLGDQTTATWQAGTGTLDSLVSPANVKAAVLALAPVNGVGVGQTWQNVSGSRSSGVWYQNTTGKPIQLFVKQVQGGDEIRIGVSTVSYVTMDNTDLDSDLDNGAFWIVPTNHYYYLVSVKGDWYELR